MGNKNSGRRPLVEEIKRHALIQTSYEITQAYLNHKGEPLKEKAGIAVGIVKTDLTKPIIIDQSTHEHKTLHIDVNTADQPALIAALLGRNNGRITEPTR